MHGYQHHLHLYKDRKMLNFRYFCTWTERESEGSVYLVVAEEEQSSVVHQLSGLSVFGL